MAIDFSQVKTITIPEGEVTKIQINGVTVWENIPVLVSITISDQITSIDRGSEFVFGGTVTANYSNGSTADVTSSATFSGYDMSVAGTYDVVASYTSGEVTKTATYSLTVNKIWESILKKPYGPLDLQSSREADSASLTKGSFSTEEAKNRPLRITWSTTASGTIYYKTFATSDNQYPDTTSIDNPFSGTPAWGSQGNNDRSYPLLRMDESSWKDGSRLYIKWGSLYFYGSSYSPRGYLTIENLEQYF